ADSANKPAVQEFAKPSTGAPAAEPEVRPGSGSAKEQHTAKHVAASTPPSHPTTPPATKPLVTTPGTGTGAGATLPNATASGTAPPSAPPAAPAPDTEFTGNLTAARATAAVNRAAELIKNHDPDRALGVLSRALKYLPTGNDSVTALYHVSEALLERADQTNTTAPRQRACTILGSLRNARGTTYAESITFMFNQYCK
ncbi:MAG: hypothetical protein ACREND_12825, partial [Gemmatimonadaceae bacterium]